MDCKRKLTKGELEHCVSMSDLEWESSGSKSDSNDSGKDLNRSEATMNKPENNLKTVQSNNVSNVKISGMK